MKYFHGLLITSIAAICLPLTLRAQTSVGDAASLQTAIDGGATSITLTGNIAVTTPIYIGTILSPTIVINGGGFTLSSSTSEIFFIQSGNITVSNLTLSGAAKGGNGGNGGMGGGGALGAGGAIFVGATANVISSNINFTNNSATGGNGGANNGSRFNSGGGGGLNGGNGGTGQGASGGGGGNGGSGGSGGQGNGGGGGLLSAGSNSPGGDPGGNGGGLLGGTAGQSRFNDGTSGGLNGGGGGGASLGNGGSGGTNGGGGGGGNGGNRGGNGGTYAGGGGARNTGGTGGFGGGGGGGGTNIGGNGGFGAGGGGTGGGQVGQGGIGGGTGAFGGPTNAPGGGGAGLGGAVFVQAGGSFTMTGNQTFSGNTVAAGSGANNGAAAGGDLFAMTGATTTFAPGTGNTQTFNSTIADDSSPSLPGGGSYRPGSGNGAAIVLGTSGNAGGTIVFNQQNTFSGGLSITNGVTVQAGNLFALGTGGVTLTSGTITMGNGVHALTMAAYTQTGGTLQLALNGSGQAATADTVTVVDQNATNLGGQLRLNLSGFTLSAGRGQVFAFALINTPNGFNGQFSSVSTLGLPHGLKVSLDYSTDDVILNLTQLQALAFTGLTPNQGGILAPINRAGNGTPTASYTKLSNALTALSTSSSILGAALDQLSPAKFSRFTSMTAFNNASFATQERDTYLAGQRVGPNGTFLGGKGQIDSSGLTLNDPNIDPSLAMVHSRMLAWTAPTGMADTASPLLGGVDMEDMKSMCNAPSNPWNFFVSGNVILAQGFSQADAPHFDDNTESVTLGADYGLTPNFLVGVTAGFAHTDATLDSFNSSATVDSYSPGIYASYADHGWFANLQGRYSYNSYTDERHIDFLHQVANGATDGNEGTADLDGGYEFHSGAWTFGPTAGLQYTHLTVNSYGESGSDANLSVREDQSDSLRSRVGGSVRYAFRSARMTFTPHLSASWQHEFMDQSRGITSQFTNFNGGSFAVRTPDSSSDSALIDAGLDAQLNKSITVFGDYLVQAGQSNYFGQSVQAGVKVNF